MSGSVLAGRYSLGALVRASTVSNVYAATDAQSSAPCSCEVLSGVRATHEALRLFASAVSRAGAVKHANLAATLDCGLTPDGQPFVVEESIAGESLDQRVAAGVLSTADAVDLIGQLLAALEASHAKSVFHLDVCAERIVMTNERGKPPRTKLTGIGVTAAVLAAHAARTLAWVNTPTWGTSRYFCPERVMATGGLDAHGDLWSAAVVAYEALTGSTPFDAPLGGALSAQIVNQWPPPPSARAPRVPTELDAIILQALHKDPRARFASATDFRKGLLGAWAKHRVAGLGGIQNRVKEITSAGVRAGSHGPTSSHANARATSPTGSEINEMKLFAVPIYKAPSVPEELTPTTQRFRVLNAPAKPPSK